MPLQSEYQRKYKTRSKSETVEDYQVKAGYRTQRRAVEHRHTPLCWDVESDEERASSAPVPESKSSDIKKNKSEVSIQKKEADKERDSFAEDRVKPSLDAKPDVIDTEKVKPNTCSGTKGKRKRTKSRSVRRTCDGKGNPPLLPYGMAYKGEGTDKKRTFNVLAADDVFPSALRAAKRREIELKRKKERKKSEVDRKIADSMFNFVPKDVDTYLTEYQRNYCNDNASQCKR